MPSNLFFVAILALLAVSVIAWGDESLIFSGGAQANFPREDCSCVCQCSKPKIGANEALAELLNEQVPMTTEIQA